MIAEAVRRSPFAAYAERFSRLHESSDGTVVIRELPFLIQLNLRADPRDGRAMSGLRDTLGIDLPTSPNTVAAGGRCRALWLGPDEWLVVGGDGQVGEIEQAIGVGLAGTFGSVVDVSANRTALQIRGARAAEVLSQGMPIDLDGRVFAVGRCAQTLLAKAQVLIERRALDSGFHLYIRSSFAMYVGDWLLDAAAGLTETSAHASQASRRD